METEEEIRSKESLTGGKGIKISLENISYCVTNSPNCLDADRKYILQNIDMIFLPG